MIHGHYVVPDPIDMLESNLRILLSLPLSKSLEYIEWTPLCRSLK